MEKELSIQQLTFIKASIERAISSRQQELDRINSQIKTWHFSHGVNRRSIIQGDRTMESLREATFVLNQIPHENPDPFNQLMTEKGYFWSAPRVDETMSEQTPQSENSEEENLVPSEQRLTNDELIMLATILSVKQGIEVLSLNTPDSEPMVFTLDQEITRVCDRIKKRPLSGDLTVEESNQEDILAIRMAALNKVKRMFESNNTQGFIDQNDTDAELLLTWLHYMHDEFLSANDSTDSVIMALLNKVPDLDKKITKERQVCRAQRQLVYGSSFPTPKSPEVVLTEEILPESRKAAA